MNKKNITIVSSTLGIFMLSPIYAATYPTIAGISLSKDTTAAQFVIYFFNLLLGIGVFAAVIMIVMAGIDYMNAEGEEGKISSAKKRIANVFYGLMILLFSWGILNMINPQLNQVKIDSPGEISLPDAPVSEEAGVYLYDAVNFVGKQKYINSNQEQLVQYDLDNKVKSIKLVSSEKYKFGTVLFTQSDFRGDSGEYCSYALNSVANLSSPSGTDNNPAMGNELSSMIVFKTISGSATVTFYNTIDCQMRSKDYCRKDDKDFPCMEDNETKCTVNSNSNFQDIREACPNLKGDVLSVSVGSGAAVLMKSVGKNDKGRCEFFAPANNSCINLIKYGYLYKPEYMPQDLKGLEKMTIIKPQSFIVFPLAR